MPRSIVRRVGGIAFLVAAAVLVALLAAPLLQPAATQDGSGFALARPLFLSTASAADADIAAFIDSEAGIAAYFKAPGALSLATARPLFRTIEAETDSYILGSIPVPDYTSESEDVHVYLHKDGWVLAYYLEETPAANIIDWARFDGTTIVTKFDTVFQVLAAQLTFTRPPATYYDFRYPSSNYLLLIAEEATTTADTFTIFLNESLAYDERSWSVSGYWARMTMDDVEIVETDLSDPPIWQDKEGVFTPLQLTVNATHTIRIDPYYRSLGGIALIYRRP